MRTSPWRAIQVATYVLIYAGFCPSANFTSTKTFNQATAAFYNSTLFKQVASENAAFLQSLPPFLDGRAVTLENMVSK